MNHQNEENMKELFEKFMDSEEAKRCIEDVQKADDILREYPAPEPDDMLISNIKAEIAMRLPARKAYSFRQIAYKAVSVAAVVLLITAVALNVFERDNVELKQEPYKAAIIPTAIWESDDITIDDANIATLTAEIEQIEDEMLSLQYGDDNGNGQGQGSVTELEMELLEIENSDFWKG